MMKKKGGLLHHLVLLPMLLGIVGCIWIRPLPLPHTEDVDTAVHISGARALLYTAQGSLEATLHIQEADILPSQTIVAAHAVMQLHDALHTRLTADTAIIQPQQPLEFLGAVLRRNNDHCSLTARSDRIFYNPTEKLLYTTYAVDIHSGRTHVHMLGIRIPLTKQEMQFGGNLHGVLDIHNNCSLGLGL